MVVSDAVMEENQREEPVAGNEQGEKELENLKEDITGQVAVIEKEKQLRRVAEEEKQQIDEGLHRVQGSVDQLKEEKEVIHREKETIKRMAETEIKRLRRSSGNKRNGTTSCEHRRIDA